MHTSSIDEDVVRLMVLATKALVSDVMESITPHESIYNIVTKQQMILETPSDNVSIWGGSSTTTTTTSLPPPPSGGCRTANTD